MEREYEKELVVIANSITQAVEHYLIPALSVIRQDDFNQIGEPESWYDAMKRALESALAVAAVSDADALALVALVQDRVNAFNRRQFHQVLRSAYRVDLFVREPHLVDLMRIWEKENLKLIRSIPVEYVAKLEGKIVNAVQRGSSLQEATKLVRDTYVMPANRAELIARDQIGKLNGQLTQERQVLIGIDSYKWRGVLDARERDEHVTREGEEFKWDSPPADGHPGHPIRCRCWGEPVLPLLDDLDALIIH